MGMVRITLVILCVCIFISNASSEEIGTGDEEAIPCVGDDCVNEYDANFEDIEFGDFGTDFQDGEDAIFSDDLEGYSDDLSDLSDGLADFPDDLGDLPTILSDLDDIETAQHDLETDADISNFFDQLSERMCELDTRIEEIKNSFASSLEALRSATHLDKCDVEYDDKCFHVMLKDSNDVTLHNAKRLCANIGWELASIYGTEHYNKINEYMRLHVFLKETKGDIWLGMEYNTETDGVLLTSSKTTIESSELIWHPLYPSNEANETGLALRVVSSTQERNQGIFNVDPNTQLNGALCEL